LSLLCWFNAEAILAQLSDDPELTAIGADYFRWRALAIIAVGCNFAFRGYWNGIRQTERYLQILVVMHIFNVVISYVLIFGRFGLPEVGAEGSGVGTTLAMFLGTALYFTLTWLRGRRQGFVRRLPPLAERRLMLRRSLPNSLQ